MSAEAVPSSRRCAVIGNPVAHSLSPALHQAAYRSLGLPWEYCAVEVTQDRLAGFVGSLGPQWRGLSVTMPLKRPAVDLCDVVEPVAREVAAVNTVLLEADGTRRGYNTDVSGFVRSLQAHGVDAVGSAVVVGAGATAGSALAAVRDLGAHTVTVVARSVERAAGMADLGRRLGVAVRLCSLQALESAASPEVLAAADVVISTVPAHAQPLAAARLASLAPVAFDVIYAPWRTPLVAAAEAANSTVIHGFDLLLHQAARQVELMTGASAAPLEDMRAAGLAAVRRP